MGAALEIAARSVLGRYPLLASQFLIPVGLPGFSGAQIWRLDPAGGYHRA